MKTQYRRMLSNLLVILSSVSRVGSTAPLIFILGTEGISSILHRIQYCYGHTNRTVIITKFQSFHYPKLDEVSMCDYLKLPGRIRCDEHSLEYWKNYSSTVHCNSNPTKIREVFSKIDSDTNVSFCVKGIEVPFGGEPDWNYTQRIWNSYQMLSTEIPSGDQLAAFHWRRGDQLKTRCENGKDSSINCAPLEHFLDKIDATIENIKIEHHIQGPLNVFIATNEQDPNILAEFARRGFHHSGQIEGILHSKNLTTNSLELFLLDTMLMCSAKWLHVFGLSVVHDFVEHCRKKLMAEMWAEPSRS